MNSCLLENNERGCFTESTEMNEEHCEDDRGAVGVMRAGVINSKINRRDVQSNSSQKLAKKLLQCKSSFTSDSFQLDDGRRQTVYSILFLIMW